MLKNRRRLAFFPCGCDKGRGSGALGTWLAQRAGSPSRDNFGGTSRAIESEYEAFLKAWTEDPVGAKPVLVRYRELLSALPGVELSTKCRPGVSFSLRARAAAQQKRELFVMVDVVDDEPENRWLSVCFYNDLVTDPEEKGDWAPEGLNGEDACCFNYDEADEAQEQYIADRLREAAANAGKPGAK